MDIKQDQAFKRLLKKLSALRATLKNDERSLLDEMVTGPADEVEAHSMNNRPHPRPASRPAGAADEVEAHSMNNRPHPRPAGRPAGSADEVEAHSMDARPHPRPHPAADEVEAHSMKDDRPHPSRPWRGVACDPDKEEYQRID